MPPLMVENLHSLARFVGREIGTTEWFAVTQDANSAVCGNHGGPAVDSRRSRTCTAGFTLRHYDCHGFLTLALLSHFLRQAIQIGSGVWMSVNYGLNRVRFPSPVPAGSRIRAHFTLQALKDIADGVEAMFSVVIDVENSEKPCCVAEWVIRYYS